MIKVPWDVFKLICANYSLQMNAFDYGSRIEIIGTKNDGTALYFCVIKKYNAEEFNDYNDNYKNNGNHTMIQG